MNRLQVLRLAALTALLLLGGCATRPVNPPLTAVDANSGYTFQTRQKHFKSQDNLVILAFSGGGTRAAALGRRRLDCAGRRPKMVACTCRPRR